MVHHRGMAKVEIPFIVEANYDGCRLDRYLQQKLGRASRAQVQRIIRDSIVQDGERPLKPSSRVTPGLRIRVLKDEVAEPEGLPEEVSILHDEDGVLIVDKPAGLPVHPTARYYRGTLTTILGRDHLDEAGRRPDPAHRLDRETSGALVCGRNPATTRALKALFSPPVGGTPEDRDRAIDKDYIAIVEGDPEWKARRIVHPLAMTREHLVRIRMSVVDPDHPGALPSSTVAEVLDRYESQEGARFTLLSCRLETGRQHQIRAHLAAEGLPIVGDKIYGHDESIFVRFTEGSMTDRDRAVLRLDRHALHAWRIAFAHPFSGCRIEVEAPLPRDLQGFLDGLSILDRE